MKILHTSDWHLGHRLHERSQIEEQKEFLSWLTQSIINQSIDVLLVAGDIFDTGVPSTQSQKLYFDFLIGLNQTTCKHIVITGGNHDAPGTINAPKALLSYLNVHVIGKATEDLKDEVFTFNIDNENLVVAAVPYLRDQDIRKAVSGETFSHVSERYTLALKNHYNDIAKICNSIELPNKVTFAMGHLFAIGGNPSDSEQSIYVGGLGDISSDDFPDIFDYIALGHLHKPQKVGGHEHIRYCGSPNMLSFSEINYKKQVLVIETDLGNITSIESLFIPVYRIVTRLSGSFSEVETDLINFNDSSQFTPWLELELDEPFITQSQLDIFKEISKEKSVEILKTSLKKKRETKGLDQLLAETESIKSLSPIEIFKLKCKDQDFDLDENVDILDAFNEVYNIAKKQ